MIRVSMPAFPVLLALLNACQADTPREASEQQLQTPLPADTLLYSSALSRYDLDQKNPETYRVSGKMSEISGLAISSEGRLFAHDDEDPVVYELDSRTGEILKRFTIGSGFMTEDFEGIAIKLDTLFLVNSSGDLYEFQEVGDKEHAEFRLTRTFLSQRNDVEGLEYDPLTDCLLLACKGYPGEGYGGQKAIYEFSLKDRALREKPRFLIPVDQVSKKARRGNFNPSGIALHSGGTFFIISAEGELVIEIDRTGAILGQEEIPGETNKQPEGIAFRPDGTMLIANDGQGGKGTITMYPEKSN
jgi:uncharacterized protein YjiK